MDVKTEKQDLVLNERLQKILNSLSKCKIDFVHEKEEHKRIRELNTKLEVELNEARELEKSHRFHLQASREMIRNLQETVSQLVYLKREEKRLKEEIALRDSTITSIEKDKELIIHKHQQLVAELQKKHEQMIRELTSANENKVLQVQHESDTQIAQLTCIIEELRSKTKDLEDENRDKINVLVLEYEQRIQRSAAQSAQLQEQLSRQAVRTDANIDAYRRRLEELEEKLKQSQFKQYLEQSTYPTQYESQVDRPYTERDPFQDSCSLDMDPVMDVPKKLPTHSQNKPQKPNTLQVTYYGNKNPISQRNIDKKGQFNITKKRKLYNDKDFNDF